MMRLIHRRMDPVTLTKIALFWAIVSSISFIRTKGEIGSIRIYAWLGDLGFTSREVGFFLLLEAFLLFATLAVRSSAPMRSMVCLCSSILWFEFGGRTLAAGLAAEGFTPRSSSADLICGFCLAVAAIEWPFFKNHHISGRL